MKLPLNAFAVLLAVSLSSSVEASLPAKELSDAESVLKLTSAKIEITQSMRFNQYGFANIGKDCAIYQRRHATQGAILEAGTLLQGTGVTRIEEEDFTRYVMTIRDSRSEIEEITCFVNRYVHPSLGDLKVMLGSALQFISAQTE
jgi:hypothetical protein